MSSVKSSILCVSRSKVALLLLLLLLLSLVLFLVVLLLFSLERGSFFVEWYCSNEENKHVNTNR